MYWGAGSALGLLTFLGYAVFLIGAAIVWRNRDDFSVWIHDEASALRRNLSRHTVVGPFYGLREESRLKVIPSQFLGSFSRIPHRSINRGGVLLLIGALLFLLDFFL
jgi:hypothetical protein